MLGEAKRGTLCGRESKAGAGPNLAKLGARQGRAAKFETTNFERLTDPYPPAKLSSGFALKSLT